MKINNNLVNLDSREFNKIVFDIKNEIKKTQIKTVREVNSNLIMLYFRIGKILEENSFYGNSFIKKVSNAIR